MSPRAQPQRHHTQQNHLEYHIVSTLTQRRTTHPSHRHTPWGQLKSHRGERCPNYWGTTQLSHRGERCPITWVCPTLGSLSGRLNSVTEENASWRISRRCNHQHSLSAREAFSTRLSISRKYSNFILASGLVKISAICSCVGSTAFLAPCL
jgi:hypothetical protein